HRKALARALGVPEHTELSAKLGTAQKLVEAAIDADKLVVLGNDFLHALVVQHKVFDIIEQLVLRAQALQKALDTGAVSANLLAANLFLFVFRAQPVEEVLPLGTQAANTGFDTIAEHTESIGQKQLRNVVAIVDQVVI